MHTSIVILSILIGLIVTIGCITFIARCSYNSSINYMMMVLPEAENKLYAAMLHFE